MGINKIFIVCQFDISQTHCKSIKVSQSVMHSHLHLTWICQTFVADICHTTFYCHLYRLSHKQFYALKSNKSQHSKSQIPYERITYRTTHKRKLVKVSIMIEFPTFFGTENENAIDYSNFQCGQMVSLRAAVLKT